MVAATLHIADRKKGLHEISEPQSTQLRIVQSMNPEAAREDLPIHYVSDNRDLSQVLPISLESYSDLSRNHLKPLLEALDRGDIEMAVALTPTNMRLCGYQVVPEEFEFYGTGERAADNWTVSIPPGIYPLFAKKFAYDEIKDQYTNELAGYPGILCWYEGRVIYDHLRKEDIGSSRVVFSNPYGHELARAILRPHEWNLYHDTPQRIFLVHPFEARELPFEFNGQMIISHGIVDASLPEYLPKGIDPITLRNGGTDLPAPTKRLCGILKDVKTRSAKTASDPHLNRTAAVIHR